VQIIFLQKNCNIFVVAGHSLIEILTSCSSKLFQFGKAGRNSRNDGTLCPRGQAIAEHLLNPVEHHSCIKEIPRIRVIKKFLFVTLQDLRVTIVEPTQSRA
jgi:hypothetical protein